MGVFSATGLPLTRGRKGLALTAIALFFTTILLVTSRNQGYRPNLDSAWLTSSMPLSVSNFASYIPEDVYKAQKYKIEAQKILDKEAFSDLNVVIWEEGVHDEVIGGIGKALVDIGVAPIFNCQFRFHFPDVLRDIVQPDPVIERPVGPSPAIERRLAEDSIDVLILTTCRFSLEKLYEHIKPSKAHVVCFWHAGNLSPDPKLRALMHELATEDRISVVVLGNAVQKTMQFKVDDWSEKFEDSAWERLPLELFVPVFDWPAKSDRARPEVYPTTAIIQGNLDKFRRGYAKIFQELEESLELDPSVWGYRSAGPDAPWEPVDANAFHLQLMGQPVPKMPLEIPERLSKLVSIHEKLDYPDYYQLLANADILLPAFHQSGYYWDTASSSIAAGAIARVPILGSDRLWKAYDYLEGPVMVKKPIAMSEVQAVRQLRVANDYVIPKDVNAQWEAMYERIKDRNIICWSRIMRRAQKLKNLGYH